MLSHFSCVRLFVTLWTVAHHDPLSIRILQARILKWVAMPSSRGSSQPRDPNHISYVSCIGRQVLYHQGHLESPYHLYVESEKYNKLVNKTKTKRNHRYRQQTSGYCGERKRVRGNTRVGGKKIIIGLYEIMCVKLLKIEKHYRI